jgi:hypothetical protein
MRIALTPSTQMDTVKEISKGTGEVAMRSLQIFFTHKKSVSGSTIKSLDIERFQFLLFFRVFGRQRKAFCGLEKTDVRL